MKKIRLLIASCDNDYVDHLSRTLAKRYVDTFSTSICTNEEGLINQITSNRYDIALFDSELAHEADLNRIRFPAILYDVFSPGERPEGFAVVNKYQKISSLVGDLLAQYSSVADSAEGIRKKAMITAVWSPAGGSGKSSVAMAYAAQVVSTGKKAMLLDMEPFSSSAAFFAEEGKSLSQLLEHLDSNVEMLAQGLRQQDRDSGVFYFGAPTNYEDLSVLTEEELRQLVEGVAGGVDELVIDLSSSCDRNNKLILLDQADSVLLVSDGTSVCTEKIRLFATQSNLYERISDKITLVLNKDAQNSPLSCQRVIRLPFVQNADPRVVYKSLSGNI